MCIIGILVYQPFRLLRAISNRSLQLFLGGLLALVIWLCLAQLVEDRVQGYFGMGTLMAILYFVFWIMTPDQKENVENDTCSVQPKCENIASVDSNSTEVINPPVKHPEPQKPAEIEPPHLSSPSIVGPELFVTLGFLGSTVEISTCARMILEFQAGKTAILNPLADRLLAQCEQLTKNPSGEWLHFARQNLSDIQDTLRASLEYLQGAFAHYGVYDVSDSEMFDDGLPHPEEISSITSAAGNKLLARQEEILAQQKGELRRAHHDAEKNIKGSGLFFAPTNSSTLFAVGLAELAVTASQTRAAQKQYDAEANLLTDWALEQMAEESRRIGLTDYYQNTLRFLDAWSEALFKIYMLEMEVRNAFTLEPLMGFSDQKSDAILKNLHRVSDKSSLLIQAFQACPYDIEVYIRADELGLLDGEGYRTARYFGFDSQLPHANSALYNDFLDEPTPYQHFESTVKECTSISSPQTNESYWPNNSENENLDSFEEDNSNVYENHQFSCTEDDELDSSEDDWFDFSESDCPDLEEDYSLNSPASDPMAELRAAILEATKDSIPPNNDEENY